MVEEKEVTKPHEVYALLPQIDVRTNGFKELNGDVESAPQLAKSSEFDPFRERKSDNNTSDCQTLTHLLKSTLGSGIMAMPCAFKHSGIVGGVLGGFIMSAVCTHTSYILIDCAHVLYYRTHKTKMDYADVVETAFSTGPKWGQKFSKFARYFVQMWLFSAYFGACSADNLLIATNFGQVIRYHMDYASLDANITGAANFTELVNAPVAVPQMRTIMSCLIVPLILLVLVPDLKYLAPISTLANAFMACVLGITFYYLVQGPKPMTELSLFKGIDSVPQFFSITLFAMENIGVMMPLENSMKTPKSLLGTCGVLNRGMFGITFVYLLLGILGYMKYGDNVNTIITTNLPVEETAAQVVKLLIGSTVLFTFSLQFYVCHEMIWTGIKDYFPNKPRLAEYIMRTLLVIACVCVAIAIPTIGPLVALVGALGFTLLGILSPVVIEIITYWDIGFGRYNWRIYKNIILIFFGIIALCFGTYIAINDIVEELT